MVLVWWLVIISDGGSLPLPTLFIGSALQNKRSLESWLLPIFLFLEWIILQWMFWNPCLFFLSFLWIFSFKTCRLCWFCERGTLSEVIGSSQGDFIPKTGYNSQDEGEVSLSFGTILWICTVVMNHVRKGEKRLLDSFFMTTHHFIVCTKFMNRLFHFLFVCDM